MGFVIDLGSLYDRLATLTDSRQARGKRYALVTLLVFVVLAKLAGEDRLAHTGAAVTRPLAATVGISSGGRRFFKSNRDKKISLASGTDFMRK